MTWAIETIITNLIATINAADLGFLSVEEPGEALPPDGPFCLVEHLGGPVDLGNLEDWTHRFRITAGVLRGGMIAQERVAVRSFALSIVRALLGNVTLDGEATLVADAEVGVSGEMNYANVPFVGCSVTVAYQTTEGIAHLVTE